MGVTVTAGIQPIDVDDPGTWPSPVTARVWEFANRLRGTTAYAADLAIPLETEDDFRALLQGRLIRAYHATRLLDHEIATVRERGLRLLSAELVRDRIEAAYNHSCITAQAREQLHEAHVFATGEERRRANRVCLFLGQHPLREDVGAVSPLLGTWGGEAVYMSSNSPRLGRVKQLGKPAVVVVDVDLSANSRTHLVFPDLQRLFVGRLLELEGLGADVHYRAPVPPDHVVAIWQPGKQEYDQFERLPRQ